MEATSVTPPAFFESSWLFSKNVYLDTFLEALCIILFVVTVFGNSLTIISVCKFDYMKSNINKLIMALSCADLYVGVMSFIYNITLLYDVYGNNPYPFYVIYSLMSTGYMASVSLLAAIAIDRVTAVLYPLHYHARITQRKLKLMIIVAWVVPILLGLIPLFPLVIYNGLWTIYPYIDYIHATFYFLVGLFILIAYVRIVPTVYNQARQMDVQALGERQIIKKEVKATITLGIVVVVYALCWLPFFIYSFIFWIVGTPLYTATIILMVCSCNSGVNFFIYALRSRDFRTAYIHLLTCGRKSRRVADFTNSGTA